MGWIGEEGHSPPHPLIVTCLSPTFLCRTSESEEECMTAEEAPDSRETHAVGGHPGRCVELSSPWCAETRGRERVWHFTTHPACPS